MPAGKLATAFFAFGMAASAFAGSKSSEVHCQIIYGGEIFPVIGKPADDPYRVEGQKIGRYFEFNIVYITEPAAYAGVNLYTYSMFSGEPILIHQAKYAPPYRQRNNRYGFTGLNSVYEPSKSSEMQYWCELRR
jgi:hypothetical protein